MNENSLKVWSREGVWNLLLVFADDGENNNEDQTY